MSSVLPSCFENQQNIFLESLSAFRVIISIKKSGGLWSLRVPAGSESHGAKLSNGVKTFHVLKP